VSPARYMLDTNILIYIRQARPSHVVARFGALQRGEAVLSVITYGELLFGLEKAPDKASAQRVLSELLSLIQIVPLPLRAGEVYGRVRAALASKGQMIGNNDLWIAAHAIATDLTLVTNNIREFERVPGLIIQNWAKAGA